MFGAVEWISWFMGLRSKMGGRGTSRGKFREMTSPVRTLSVVALRMRSGVRRLSLPSW